MVAIFRDAALALARGLGQLVLADRVAAGLLVLAGLALISPWGALGAVAGAAFGTAAGRIVPSCSRAEWSQGIAGFNSAIVGLFWAGQFAAGDGNLILFLSVLAICVAIEIGLRQGLARFGLPALSLPAVVTLVAASLILSPDATWYWIDAPAPALGPAGLVAGLACFAVAMGTKSVAAAAWSVIVAAAGYQAIALFGFGPTATAGLWAINLPLATFAVGAVFLRHQAIAPMAGALSALVTALLWLAWVASGVSTLAPPLFTPFILGVWCAILGARRARDWPVAQPAFWRAVLAIAVARARGRRVVALLGGDAANYDRALENFCRFRGEGTAQPCPATGDRLRTSSRWRRAFWRASAELREAARLGAPTELHGRLADMARRDLVAAIVTQQDGARLRQAGAPNVTDLHGSLDQVGCLDCAADRPWPPRRIWRHYDLRCSTCGGFVTPRSDALRA